MRSLTPKTRNLLFKTTELVTHHHDLTDLTFRLDHELLLMTHMACLMDLAQIDLYVFARIY